MARKKKAEIGCVKRKATPEEVAYYNSRLEKEHNRLMRCRTLGITNSTPIQNGKLVTAGIVE